MRLAIVLFVSGFTGLCLTRCASTPTPRETVQAIDDTDDLEDLIEESNLSPEKKSQGKAKAANVKDTLQKQGETITRQAATISALEKYKSAVIGFVVAMVLVIIGGVYWFIRRRAAAA